MTLVFYNIMDNLIPNSMINEPYENGTKKKICTERWIYHLKSLKQLSITSFLMFLAYSDCYRQTSLLYEQNSYQIIHYGKNK